MSLDSFHLVRDVLDHQIVDVDDTPCGVVDNVVLAKAAGHELRIVAMLVGRAASNRRVPRPLAKLFALLCGHSTRRIAWHHVARMDDRVVLDQPARVLGLDRADRRLGQWLSRIPGA